MKLSTAINNTLTRWNKEAAIFFAMKGKAGAKLRREVWANGKTMVGWEGALPNQFIPLAQATTIWKAGWKVVV